MDELTNQVMAIILMLAGIIFFIISFALLSLKKNFQEETRRRALRIEIAFAIIGLIFLGIGILLIVS